MELQGCSSYQFTPNFNNEFKLFLSFSSSDGISFKDSSTNGVVGNIYADMTANILSFGPSCAIRLIGNNSNSYLYEIWIQLSAKAGVVNFKTDTPEHTTFLVYQELHR